MALELIVTPEFNIIEFGTGGSTVFFADRAKSVKSFDYDEIWTEKVRQKLNGRNNVELICGDREKFIGLLQKEPDNYYDLALIDIGAVKETLKDRITYARLVTPKIKTGRYIVVDNYERWYIRRFDWSPYEVFTFDDLQDMTIPGHYAGRGTRIGIKK